MINLLYGEFCLHHDQFEGDQILSSIRLIFQEIYVEQGWDDILNFKRRLDYGERSFWVDYASWFLFTQGSLVLNQRIRTFSTVGFTLAPGGMGL
jgi:hypothetical protein